MAEMIWTINSGAIKGLCSMGFIPEDAPIASTSSRHDLGVVKQAFSNYYSWITARLNDEERDKVKEGAGSVARALSDLLTRSNTPHDLLG